MSSKIIFCCIAVLTLFMQCKKKFPSKPDPDPDFQCVVHGQPWIAKTPFSIMGPAHLTTEYADSTGSLLMTAVRTNDSESYFEEIRLLAKDVYGPGTYTLYTGDGDFFGFIDLADNYSCGGYFHDVQHPGTLTVTVFDPAHHQMRGTFQAVLMNHDCSPDSTLVIANGKFHIGF